MDDELDGSDWVGSFYDELLADLLLRRDPDAGEITFLRRELGLFDGARVLDQGCGIGSLAVPLGLQGVHVVGVDQCAGYVAEARAASGGRGTFHVADARVFRPDAPVDAAFSWWTSWGHTPDDAGNLAMLCRVHEALQPSGTFALDTMNVSGVLRGFQAETVLERHVPRLGGTVRLHRASTVDTATGTLQKLWTYHLPDGQVVRHRSAMRLYMPWQVAAMLRDAGFATVRLLGSPEGEDLVLDSPRLIAVARRAP